MSQRARLIRLRRARAAAERVKRAAWDDGAQITMTGATMTALQFEHDPAGICWGMSREQLAAYARRPRARGATLT